MLGLAGFFTLIPKYSIMFDSIQLRNTDNILLFLNQMPIYLIIDLI